MKRTIILECNGHKDNYIEGDFVLMRPVSQETFEKRKLDRDGQIDTNSYYCSDPQQPMVDMREQMYGDKYILGRIERVTDTYKGERRAMVDFACITSEYRWKAWKPFGWRYNYFDALHVDMIKVFDNMKYNWLDFRREVNKNKVLGGIPISKIVMCKGASTRRADMSTQIQESICNKAESRWRERHLTSTPTEI